MLEFAHIYAVVFGLAAAFIGFNKNRVPNQLLLLLIVLFPAVMFLTGSTFSEMLPHLIAFVAAFVLAVVAFMLVGSGGLWKMLAVVALWTPVSMLSTTAAAVFIIPLVLLLAAKPISEKLTGHIADHYTVIAMTIAVGVNLYGVQFI
ncbi:MAG: hypothetical protein AAF423_13850 [Pseudomonadota bacterium]